MMSADFEDLMNKLRKDIKTFLNVMLIVTAIYINTPMAARKVLIEGSSRDLKKNQQELIIKLQKYGLSTKEIVEDINALKYAKENQYSDVISLLGKNLIKKDISNINNIIMSIQHDINEIEFHIRMQIDEEDNRKSVLNQLINVKGKLEILRKKYGIDTRETETVILKLEKEYKKLRESGKM